MYHEAGKFPSKRGSLGFSPEAAPLVLDPFNRFAKTSSMFGIQRECRTNAGDEGRRASSGKWMPLMHRRKVKIIKASPLVVTRSACVLPMRWK